MGKKVDRLKKTSTKEKTWQREEKKTKNFENMAWHGACIYNREENVGNESKMKI